MRTHTGAYASLCLCFIFSFSLAPLITWDRSPTTHHRQYHARASYGRHQGHGLTRELEREVESRKHDSCKNPPPQQTYHKRQSTARLLEHGRNGRLRVDGQVPVRSRETGKRRDEKREDEEEDDVGTEGADHVDEAENAHPEEEEAWVIALACVPGTLLSGMRHTKCRVPACCLRAHYITSSISSSRVIEGSQSCAEDEPEGAEGVEDHTGEGIADDPLRKGFVSTSTSHRLHVVRSLEGFPTSPVAPRTMMRPPKKKYVPMFAAPLPPAPRQPMSVQERGVRVMMKPEMALRGGSAFDDSTEIEISRSTYTGVGLPNVFRSSPATLFWGER